MSSDVLPDLRIKPSLRQLISGNLQKLNVAPLPAGSYKRAAVAITIINTEADVGIGDLKLPPHELDQAAIILTTRASRLKNHGGQRAFPGGRIDAGETAEQAALRELSEEVGLDLDPEQILGRLDDYATRSGFLITPIVVWAGTCCELIPNPGEVDRIHHIPLRELLRGDAPMLESIPESRFPVLKMPLGNEWFAAPSAAIAYQFREVAILGRLTRVAHFEQPYFAWS